jgi:hypothetical protein
MGDTSRISMKSRSRCSRGPLAFMLVLYHLLWMINNHEGGSWP